MEKRDSVKKLKLFTFWNTLLKPQLLVDIKNVFLSLWDGNFLLFTKPKVTSLIKEHLLTSMGGDEINRNWDKCEYLKKKKKKIQMKAK